ncbi:aminotransferase class I/II-fold pyridoxal phosphate-dependent enzyme [Phenylobacterium sp. 58.2.17]|uniref:aminotransferase class I/II-fold pyridoxal phosphate-dependent enzyme n=1 Tax=Phenylobacterium sp. 58.2.17 TaxID=2969306 RepID=UPI0022640E69|nr:aminotransferase class I/II-fold pyridoxal phosphate-dependent enzyme [Phenylobacterium sp. 58.2.17]MCX7588120.1 aminotransferase class I/II-fold pyridoxal phosphate-dependent enzyme [Phenylobacterium sp. 58.2.17]
MPSKSPKPAGSHTPSPEDYSNWVRAAMRNIAATPDAAVLFDSTIKEPTELLAQVVRGAFGGEITDRYESVFANGNRFVAAAVARRYGVQPANVLCTTGATSAMAMAIRAFIEPGDHVIVETPCFDLLPGLAAAAGATISYLPRRAPDFAVDAAELEGLIRPQTRLVLLTDLHNPSGASLGQGTLLALAALAGKSGVRIVIDEVYGDFAGPHAAAATYSPEIISVGSLTKVQGLFALKCGWAIAAPDKIARILAASEQGDMGVSKLSHAVAARVLEDMAPFDDHWRGLLARSRPVLERHAQSMIAEGLLAGELPAHGCMYFPRVVGVADTHAFAEWLWREHHVMVAPGEFYGLPGHVRIGFGGDAEPLDRGLGRFADALRRYSR